MKILITIIILITNSFAANLPSAIEAYEEFCTKNDIASQLRQQEFGAILWERDLIVTHENDSKGVQKRTIKLNIEGIEDYPSTWLHECFLSDGTKVDIK